jgi:hypothetical protein
LAGIYLIVSLSVVHPEFFIVVLGVDTLWHLQKLLQCIKYIILEFTTSTILFYLPPPIPGIVSTDLIVPFIYMSTQYLHHIHPPTPSPHIFPLPLITTPQTGFILPSCSPIIFLKRYFCLFKIAIQGV